MSEEKTFWTKLLSFFGVRDEKHDKEVMDSYRSRITKEKIAELSEVIDGQIDTLTALEQNWHATYERVENYVRERDEQDAAFAGELAALSEELDRLGDNLPEDETAHYRRKVLSVLYEDSRFYVGMAESLKELLSSHRACIDELFERANAANKALGGVSGVTLQAAMLCARFGEDAGEFAAVCDRIRLQVSAAAEETAAMVKAIEEERQAYEDTFEQLERLNGQLIKARDAVTSLYEGQKESDRKAFRPREAVEQMRMNIEAMSGHLNDAGEASRGICEETEGFREIDEQEAKSRAEIETVVQEIHRMITEA